MKEKEVKDEISFVPLFYLSETYLRLYELLLETSNRSILNKPPPIIGLDKLLKLFFKLL